ncbi:retinol-binding protein pinta-like [Pseudomyrmex gracilis]|uniref:retinol-binding protein pinta-like n=1 Tax=Pseudomyrmex gracilis TaxID=219809 RepID=UPI000994F116|nr:retinol-binding protein pinta-like [Pseudomyrmex gracilis]
MMDCRCYDDDCVIHKLTLDQKMYATTFLNETNNGKKNAIMEIKRWIQESNDLCARTDDFFILRFLRACKFNIEKTKTKMWNYYKQRSILPEWYTNKDPFRSELQELFNIGVFLPLRQLDNEGRMVILLRVTRHNPSIHTLSNVIKVGLMTLDVLTRDHVAGSVCGVVAFIDLDGVKMGHVSQLRPDIVHNVVHAWQGCYPLRIQALNFINAPEYVDVILRLFKRLMNEKLKQRIHVYTSKMKDSCLKNVPADRLPAEYGGTNGTIDELKAYWKKIVEDNRDWIIDDEKYKVIKK